MEPLLLVCGGCGVKIRAADPDRARTRECPRCATPLADAVATAFRSHRARSVEGPIANTPTPDSISVGTDRLDAGFATATAPPRWWPRVTVAAVGLIGVAAVLHLWLADRGSPGDKLAAPERSRPRFAAPILSLSRAPVLPPESRQSGPADSPTLALANLPDGDAADLAEQVPAPPSPLAFRAGEPTNPSTATPQAVGPATKPARSAAPSPAVTATEAAAAVGSGAGSPAGSLLVPAEPHRLLIRDGTGKAVVAREHGVMKDQMAVVLPDGTIGWPTTQVFTEEPFVPYTLDEMERILLDGEYNTFRVLRTKHYLVFYQSSERFARDSADLLEDLYDKLTGALLRQKLPVVPAEFPLIAVIFRSEDDFRANRKVAGEVQAYYEILSNRIFFYEKGKRDATSPEVALLRKPQTVAHEGTHQLLHNVGIQRRMSPWPIWLVEGLAEYCSPPKPLKQGGANWAGLGQINPIHLTTIRDLDDPMSSVVKGGPKAPSGRDRGQPLVEYLVTRTDLTPTDYALSWGLTHYLARDKDRLEQFTNYILKLNQLLPFETRTPDEQLADFRAAFGTDLAKLDAQVGKHLAKLKIPESQALPFYAVLLEQPVATNRVRRMAMVSQSPSVIRQWVETASHSSGGQVNWQVFPHPTRTRAVMTADGWINQGH